MSEQKIKNRYVLLLLTLGLVWTVGSVGTVGSELTDVVVKDTERAVEGVAREAVEGAGGVAGEAEGKAAGGANEVLGKTTSGVHVEPGSALPRSDTPSVDLEERAEGPANKLKTGDLAKSALDDSVEKLPEGELNQLKDEWGGLDRETKLQLKEKFPAEFGGMSESMNYTEYFKDRFGYNPSRTWVQFGLDTVGGFGNWLVQHALIGGFIMGVIFGMPNALQSQLSEKISNLVALANLGATIQFGQWTLLQIPDDFLNKPNALASKKIYMLVPKNVAKGDKATAHNPIVGPAGDKNTIADYIKENGAATGGSFVSAMMAMQFDKLGKRIVGSAADMGVNRYNVFLGTGNLASFYDQAIFVASYPEASYGKIGEDAVQDPTFSGKLVCLNNGVIITRDGIDYTAPLVPLFGMDTSNGPTIEEFLSKFGADIGIGEVSISTNSIEDKTNFRKTGKISGCLARQFSLACIDKETRLMSACVNTKSHQRSSLLATTLAAYQDGAYLTAQGTMAVAFDQATLQRDYAAGALGSVSPIKGLSTGMMKYIQDHFPSVDPSKLDLSSFGSVLSGVTVADQDRAVTGGAAVTTTSSAQIIGADDWNYTAYTVYVYICQNTPFAREYNFVTGTQNGFDYIVCLDKDLNIVPLQYPVLNQKTGLIEIGMNPNAIYWSSLLSYNLSEFQLPDGKGGTATPVYVLQDNNEMGALKAGLAVNLPQAKAALDGYMQNLAKLGGDSGIVNQIKLMQLVLMQEYRNAPELRPYDLVPVDASMNMTKDTTSIVVYQGIGCYPLPIGDEKIAADYLVPFMQDAKGTTQTVQLPNVNVKFLISLVTGVVYGVTQVGKAYSLQPIGFKGQFDATTSLTLDTTKSKYPILDSFKSAGITIPDALQSALDSSYTAWAAWLKQAAASPVNNSKEQIYGMPFAKSILQIASMQDFANNNFMYSCIPSLSNIVDDLYVVADSLNTTQNSTVGLKATGSNKYVVSLATGNVYDSTGAQAVDANNKNVVFDTSMLLTLVLRNQKANYAKALGLSSYTHDLLVKQQAQNQSTNVVAGPFSYGLLRLFMYHSDLVGENYLYFTQDESGLPNNYFVAVDATGAVGGPITAKTVAVVSLVSGTQYTTGGQSGVVPDVKTLLAAAQKTVHFSGKDLAAIQTMAQQFQAASAQADKDDAAAQATKDAQTQARLAYEATLPVVATKMLTLSYLLAPYDGLKQDPATGAYYYVQATATNGLMITDFNGFGGQIALFNEKGEIQLYHDGHAVITMREHYGVVVDAKGKQSLTVPQDAEVLNFSEKDQAIQPGQSGDQLIVSTDSKFPLSGLKPMTVGTTQYTFYYFTPLSLYLVYVADTVKKTGYYLNVSSGYQYDVTGAPLFAENVIAVDSAQNLLFPTKDTNGMLSVMVANPASGKMMTEFDSVASAFTTKVASDGSIIGVNSVKASQAPFNTITVLQSPIQSGSTYNDQATQYGVMFNPQDQTKVSTFTVNPGYSYYSLHYVPLDAVAGKALTSQVGAQYQDLKIILQKGAVQGVVFKGKIYNVTKALGTTFTCAAVDGSTITVQEKTDSFNNPYVVVKDGAQNYVYGYEYAIKPANQMQAYMQAIWKLAMTLSQNMGAQLTYLLDTRSLKAVPGQSTIKYESSHDRYFALVTSGQYPTVDQDVYVDLSTGNVFDKSGKSLGHSLFANDFGTLLQTLQVAVRYDTTTGKNKLTPNTGGLSGVSSAAQTMLGATSSQASAALGATATQASAALGAPQQPVLGGNQQSLALGTGKASTGTPPGVGIGMQQQSSAMLAA